MWRVTLIGALSLFVIAGLSSIDAVGILSDSDWNDNNTFATAAVGA